MTEERKIVIPKQFQNIPLNIHIKRCEQAKKTLGIFREPIVKTVLPK